MGSYEREMQLVQQGKAERGQTALEYFAQIDAELPPEASMKTHRPNYKRTLFAPENDDIYREFCAYVDLPEPRSFDDVPNPIRVDGYTAGDIYFAMKSKNDRIYRIDAAAVYNMMVRLRTSPEIAHKVLDFHPTCYQAGCGFKDAAFDRGDYDWQKQQ